MNVEIGTEAVQFPEKEYIFGIFVAVHSNVKGPAWTPLLYICDLQYLKFDVNQQ
jgi:hypothetical protein